MTNKDLKDLVYNYNTKYKQGFVNTEINELLKMFPNINIGKFNDAFMANTCFGIDGNTIFFRDDVLTALLCGIENRGIKSTEFD